MGCDSDQQEETVRIVLSKPGSIEVWRYDYSDPSPFNLILRVGLQDLYTAQQRVPEDVRTYYAPESNNPDLGRVIDAIWIVPPDKQDVTAKGDREDEVQIPTYLMLVSSTKWFLLEVPTDSESSGPRYHSLNEGFIMGNEMQHVPCKNVFLGEKHMVVIVDPDPDPHNEDVTNKSLLPARVTGFDMTPVLRLESGHGILYGEMQFRAGRPWSDLNFRNTLARIIFLDNETRAIAQPTFATLSKQVWFSKAIEWFKGTTGSLEPQGLQLSLASNILVVLKRALKRAKARIRERSQRRDEFVQHVVDDARDQVIKEAWKDAITAFRKRQNAVMSPRDAQI